jgi:hypothetical protein
VCVCVALVIQQKCASVISVACPTLLWPAPLYCGLPHSTVACSALLWPAPLYCGLPHSTVACSALLWPAPLYCGLPRSTVACPTLLWPAPLYCGLLRSTTFPHIISQTARFSKIIIEHKTCVLIFCTIFI